MSMLKKFKNFEVKEEDRLSDADKLLLVNGVGIPSLFEKRRATMYSFEIFDDDFYNDPEVTYIGYEMSKDGRPVYKGVIDLDICYGENLFKALEDYLGPDINASVKRLLKQPLAKELPDPLQRVVLGQYSCSEGMYFILNNTFCREEWEPSEFLSLRQQMEEYGLDEFMEILDFDDFDDLDEDEEIVAVYCGLAGQFNFLGYEMEVLP